LYGANAERIDSQLKASIQFSRGNAALAEKIGPSTSVTNHLLRIASHLAMAEDLMIYGVIQPATAFNANAVNARSDIVIGSSSSGYEAPSSAGVSPLSVASIFANADQPALTNQVAFAPTAANGNAPYELAGVSVFVNGKSVPVIFVSPTRVIFHTSAEVTLGNSEVLVTSQEGFLSLGSITVSAGVFRLMASGPGGTGAAIAINGSTHTGNSFNVVTPENFGPDKRTRVRILATGVSGNALNTNPTNDLLLNGTWRPNFAESVVVEARLPNGNVLGYLPVEFAGSAGTLPGLDQLDLILPAQYQGVGTVELTLIISGSRSNAPSIVIN
jgi:uncharacterized protein (TIGR03437 family)